MADFSETNLIPFQMALSKPEELDKDIDAFHNFFMGQMSFFEVGLSDRMAKSQFAHLKQSFHAKMSAISRSMADVVKDHKRLSQAKQNLHLRVERLDKQITRLSSVPLPCISTPTRPTPHDSTECHTPDISDIADDVLTQSLDRALASNDVSDQPAPVPPQKDAPAETEIPAPQKQKEEDDNNVTEEEALEIISE